MHLHLHEHSRSGNKSNISSHHLAYSESVEQPRAQPTMRVSDRTDHKRAMTHTPEVNTLDPYSLVTSAHRLRATLLLVLLLALQQSLLQAESKTHHSKRQTPSGGPAWTGRESNNWWNLWWQQYINEAIEPTVRPIVAISFNGHTIGLNDEQMRNLDSNMVASHMHKTDPQDPDIHDFAPVDPKWEQLRQHHHQQIRQTMIDSELRANRQPGMFINNRQTVEQPKFEQNLGIQMRSNLVNSQQAARANSNNNKLTNQMLEWAQLQPLEEGNNFEQQQQHQMADYNEEMEPDIEQNNVNTNNNINNNTDDDQMTRAKDSSSSSMMIEQSRPPTSQNSVQPDQQPKRRPTPPLHIPENLGFPSFSQSLDRSGLSTTSLPFMEVARTTEGQTRPSQRVSSTTSLADQTTRVATNGLPTTTTTPEIQRKTTSTSSPGEQEISETPISSSTDGRVEQPTNKQTKTTKTDRVQLENGRPASGMRLQGTTTASRLPTGTKPVSSTATSESMSSMISTTPSTNSNLTLFGIQSIQQSSSSSTIPPRMLSEETARARAQGKNSSPTSANPSASTTLSPTTSSGEITALPEGSTEDDSREDDEEEDSTEEPTSTAMSTDVSSDSDDGAPGTKGTTQLPLLTTIDIERLPKGSSETMRTSTVSSTSVESDVARIKTSTAESTSTERPAQQSKGNLVMMRLDQSVGTIDAETAITVPMEALMKIVMNQIAVEAQQPELGEQRIVMDQRGVGVNQMTSRPFTSSPTRTTTEGGQTQPEVSFTVSSTMTTAGGQPAEKGTQQDLRLAEVQASSRKKPQPPPTTKAPSKQTTGSSNDSISRGATGMQETSATKSGSMGVEPTSATTSQEIGARSEPKIELLNMDLMPIDRIISQMPTMRAKTNGRMEHNQPATVESIPDVEPGMRLKPQLMNKTSLMQQQLMNTNGQDTVYMIMMNSLPSNESLAPTKKVAQQRNGSTKSPPQLTTTTTVMMQRQQSDKTIPSQPKIIPTTQQGTSLPTTQTALQPETTERMRASTPSSLRTSQTNAVSPSSPQFDADDQHRFKMPQFQSNKPESAVQQEVSSSRPDGSLQSGDSQFKSSPSTPPSTVSTSQSSSREETTTERSSTTKPTQTPTQAPTVTVFNLSSIPGVISQGSDGMRGKLIASSSPKMTTTTIPAQGQAEVEKSSVSPRQPVSIHTVKGTKKTTKVSNTTSFQSSFIPAKLRFEFTGENLNKSPLSQSAGREQGQQLVQLPTTSQTPLGGAAQSMAIRQFGGANRMSVLAQHPVPFGRPAAMMMPPGSRSNLIPSFEYGPSIAVRRPDEPLANGQIPNCTLTGKNFCVLTKDYPMNEVRQAVERSFRSVRIMYEELQTVSDQELFRDDQNASTNQAATGKFACQTQVEMMRPGWAKDEITKEWMLVVNTDVFPQKVRTESCAQPNTPCEFIAPFYDSTCQQRYSLHRMIAIDPHDPSRSPQVAVFKFPAGCVCRVHPIRKTTTVSSLMQTTASTTLAPKAIFSTTNKSSESSKEH